MVNRIDDLPRIIARHQRRINRAVEKTTKEAVVKAQETAVLATRVDTGLARSNWFATIGTPSVGVIPPYAPGLKLGKGERANATAAINQAKNVVRAWSLESQALIFITNNTPYIETLNNGRPAVAPDNMLEKAVQSGVIAIQTGLRNNLMSGRRSR